MEQLLEVLAADPPQPASEAPTAQSKLPPADSPTPTLNCRDDQLTALLDCLWPGGAPPVGELRGLAGTNRVESFRGLGHLDIAKAGRDAMHEGFRVNLCSVRGDLGPTKRGGLEDVVACPALVLGIDHDEPAEVLKALTELRPQWRPTVALPSSEKGVHAFWVLDQPAMGSHLERAKKEWKDLQEHLRGALRSSSPVLRAATDIDLHDLASCIRLTGSWKPGREKPAGFVRKIGPRYSWTDLRRTFRWAEIDTALLDPDGDEAEAEVLAPFLAWRASITLLSTVPKVGKSTLCWQAANAVATGGEFLGETATKGRVLWVGEERPWQYNRRQQGQTGSKRRPDLDVLTLPSLRRIASSLGKTTAEAVAGYAAERGYDLVFIDSLLKFSAASVKDANLPSEWNRFLTPLSDVVESHGTSIVLLHHAPRGSDGRPMASNQIEAEADIVIAGKRSNGGIRHFKVTGRSGLDRDFKTRFDKDTELSTLLSTEDDGAKQAPGKKQSKLAKKVRRTHDEATYLRGIVDFAQTWDGNPEGFCMNDLRNSEYRIGSGKRKNRKLAEKVRDRLIAAGRLIGTVDARRTTRYLLASEGTRNLAATLESCAEVAGTELRPPDSLIPLQDKGFGESQALST